MKYINPYNLFIGSFIPNWLDERTEVSSNAKRVYAKLCQHAGRNGRCYPKQETIGRELGLSRKTVSTATSELIEHCLISRNKQGLGMPNTYTFYEHPWMGYYKVPLLNS